jgi:(1->4)-alpha-D-glucan 1-alpha-D-glucosylmutase
MSALVKPPEQPLAEEPPAIAAPEEAFVAIERRIAGRRLPEATYRVQFNRSFPFASARELVPYLAALGISDCYSSPYAKARPGSAHGYDIVDHNTLNPEIGSAEEYDEFVRELHFHGMGQILDVVPNHMGISAADNAWWADVLENGPSSPYASFFDIDWMPLKPDLAHKVLLPILEDQFGKVLEDQKFTLGLEDGGFYLHYYNRRFPIAPQSWPLILRQRAEELEKTLGQEHPHVQEYQSILFAIAHLPPNTAGDPENVSECRREKEVIRRRLNELCAASPEVRASLDETLRIFNGRRGDPASFNLLDQLLLDQAYRLAYWQVAADEINYRRFFDVNELAAICMERREVFDAAHALVLKLVAEGKIDGLRIDHPDGLYDPPEYLRRLQDARWRQFCQEALAEPSAAGPPALDDAVLDELDSRRQAILAEKPDSPLARPLYVVVEKILEAEEKLPADWPVCGTTGYDFLNVLSGLFVDRSQARAFDRLYSRFIRDKIDFGELAYRCKKLIMQVSMSSEIVVLGHQLDRISEQNRRSRDFTLNSLTGAIREVIACFPVYRTYVAERGEVSDRDRHYVGLAVARARLKNPAISPSLFDFLRDILLLNYPDNADEAAKSDQRRFVGKFQQVTGPVMAKAVEDTAFYIFNRLISLNEVGGDPEHFGIAPAEFHQQNLERQARWPHALLPTSTHDTKRGEDVRARINVLSELSQDWKSRLGHWARWNKRRKTLVDGKPAPSRNDEYLLYQTLLGTWPLEPFAKDSRREYIERIGSYMLKATREAKVNTSWISPNEAYEKATRGFLVAILAESPRNLFLGDFVPFARRVADLGIWNSLSQTLLKLTSPGVPDIYQGSELFDFRLVDPDNRQPVDYARRREMLESLHEEVDGAGGDLRQLAAELVAARADGRIKLLLIQTLLNYRREHPGLFTTGEYRPLEAVGARREHVCAFARRLGDSLVLVAVPRLVAGLTSPQFGPPLGAEIWGDTRFIFPPDLSVTRCVNLLTGETLEGSASAPQPDLPLASIFATFPVAVLECTSGLSA